MKSERSSRHGRPMFAPSRPRRLCEGLPRAAPYYLTRLWMPYALWIESLPSRNHDRSLRIRKLSGGSRVARADPAIRVHRCIEVGLQERRSVEYVPCKQWDLPTVISLGGKRTLWSSIFEGPNRLLLTSQAPER